MRILSILTTLVVLLTIGACTTEVDVDAEKAAITEVLMSIEKANQEKNTEGYVSNLDENGLFCGTDPDEFWNMKSVTVEIEKMFADENFDPSYTVETRDVILAENGKAAIAYEQTVADYISEHIPIRFVYHLIKKDEVWLVDFLSVSLIPQNEDIAKINGAFMTEELD